MKLLPALIGFSAATEDSSKSRFKLHKLKYRSLHHLINDIYGPYAGDKEITNLMQISSQNLKRENCIEIPE